MTMYALGPFHESPGSFTRITSARSELQSAATSASLPHFFCHDLKRRTLEALRGSGARSSALPHTPTCRELYCRRIVGSVMVRIGFERNEPWLKKVFTIAFLSLMDELEPIHSRRERRARRVKN